MPSPSLPFACTNPHAKHLLRRFNGEASESRSISQVKHLSVQGLLQVVLFHSTAPELVVVCSDPNMSKRVRTEMRGPDTLCVYCDDGNRSNEERHDVSASNGSIASTGDITVVHASHGAIAAGRHVIINGERISSDASIDALVGIALPYAPDVSLAGSGDITLFDVEQSTIAMELAGSGTITARGKVEHLSINVSGSGDVEAQELIAAAANLTITGSGSVAAVSTTSLNASVIGSGDIQVRGKPSHVQQSVVGSGSIDVL